MLYLDELTKKTIQAFEDVEAMAKMFKERGFDFVITSKSIEPISGCDVLITATSKEIKG